MVIYSKNFVGIEDIEDFIRSGTKNFTWPRLCLHLDGIDHLTVISLSKMQQYCTHTQQSGLSNNIKLPLTEKYYRFYML